MHPIDRLHYFHSYPYLLMRDHLNETIQNIQNRCLTPYLQATQRWIRDSFFIVSTRNQKQLEDIEISYSSRFFDKSSPLIGTLKHHQTIKEQFTYEIVSKQIQVGTKTLQVKCALISTGQNPSYTLMYCLGQYGVIREEGSTNIAQIAPFLDAYIEKMTSEGKPLSMRIIQYSAYGTYLVESGKITPYRPQTLEEKGKILAATVEAFYNESKVPIDQIIGFSLGSITLASALSFFSDKATPKNLFFDRGPTKIADLSKRILGSTLSFFLHPVIKTLGWDIDLASAICDFHKKSSSTIVISGVVQDRIFPPSCSLAFDPKILSLKERVTVLQWNFSIQAIHPASAHCISYTAQDSFHLEKETAPFLKKHATLAEAIIANYFKSD